MEQLEKAQKNLLVMKQQYEEKMTLLQQQIRSVESERDKVLKDMGEHLAYIHVHVHVQCMYIQLYVHEEQKYMYMYMYTPVQYAVYSVYCMW